MSNRHELKPTPLILHNSTLIKEMISHEKVENIKLDEKSIIEELLENSEVKNIFEIRSTNSLGAVAYFITLRGNVIRLKADPGAKSCIDEMAIRAYIKEIVERPSNRLTTKHLIVYDNILYDS